MKQRGSENARLRELEGVRVQKNDKNEVMVQQNVNYVHRGSEGRYYVYLDIMLGVFRI